MKTIIIDDQAQARQLLRAKLNRYCPQVEVVAEADSVPAAVQAVNTHKPDLVFSDIDMPDYYGFELVRFIDKPDFALIFVTAHSKYAIQAFEASAIDYLLKPVEAEALKRAVEKAQHYQTGRQQQLQKIDALQQNLTTGQTRKIALSTAEELIFVETADISYLIADGSYTHMMLSGSDKKTTIAKGLRFFEECLSYPPFFRPHRSYIINLNEVDRYIKAGHYVVMKDGFQLSLSKDRQKDFIEAMKMLETLNQNC